ncbi:MAG: transposase [Bacteriovorax sp.]|jgi:REP element-mobilizing transposase RayT
MKKKTLINIKGAGRPAIHDRGIRHIARDEINRPTPLHLTIKIERPKAGLKNKSILKVLHRSIKKARMAGIRIIHYTLEFDHVHLLVEASDKLSTSKGMQSFGITLSKGINKIKAMKGRVFKTRYHFRKLKTPGEIKNVLNYILGNSIKHKYATSIITPYNSIMAVKNFSNLYPGFETMIESVITKSFLLLNLKNELKDILSPAKNYHLRRLTD